MSDKYELEAMVKMTESYAISVERLIAGYNQLYAWGRNTNPNVNPDDPDMEVSQREKRRLIELKSQYYGNAYRTLDILSSLSRAMREAWSKYEGEDDESDGE